MEYGRSMAEAQRSQRERIVDAMIATAGRRGYAESSVARVIKEAGVSRASFYEHFADRRAAFLAAREQAAVRIPLSPAAATDGAFSRSWLEDLLRACQASPAAARVLLIESLAAGKEARSRRDEEMATAALALGELLSGQAPPTSLVPASVVLAGVTGVVALHVFRGEVAGLVPLRDGLLAWSDAHRGAGPPVDWGEWGRGLPGEAAPESLGEAVLDRRLPRGRGALAPSLVAGEQRERILAAVARLSREVGYAEMSVADLVDTAHVTRKAFYEHFRDKQDAFLAAQAFGLEQSVGVTAGRFFGAEAWPERVWNGLQATLGYVAGQRDLAFVDLVESYAAGPPAVRRTFENRTAYTLFLEEGYRQRPEAEDMPRVSSDAIAAAIGELMRTKVLAGQTERMLEALPLAAFLTLAPFTGPDAALGLIEEKTGRPAPRFAARPGGG